MDQNPWDYYAQPDTSQFLHNQQIEAFQQALDEKHIELVDARFTIRVMTVALIVSLTGNLLQWVLS